MPIKAYKRRFRNMDVGLELRFVQSYVYISRFQRGKTISMLYQFRGGGVGELANFL